MKKAVLIICLLLLSAAPILAQTGKISFSSEELLDGVCRINSSTVVQYVSDTVREVSLLAVIPCFMDEASQSGFYYKDGNKWTLIRSENQRQCFPEDVSFYSDAVNFVGLSIDRSFIGKYAPLRLLVLEYEDSTCWTYDIFDVESKEVIFCGGR